MSFIGDMVLLVGAMGVGAALLHLRQWLSDPGSASTGHGPPGEPDHAGVDHAFLNALDRAVSGNHLYLAYQPKLDARANHICGAEALLRWDALPQHGLSVEQLIKAAERNGRIAAVTHWVVERVLADLNGPVASAPGIKLWINLSAVLLIDDDFMIPLTAQITPFAARVGLEITETAVIADPLRAIANLQRLADAGIAVAIDDYGTGVSSLAYLKQMPVAEMKIDRAFVANLTSSNRDPLIIRSTIDLAHALDMTVTAEGVDNPISQALLAVMGCDYLQGHHIGKPMPLADLMQMIATRGAPSPAPDAEPDEGPTSYNLGKTG